MYKVSRPEDVVFYTNSDEKSIVLVTNDGRMTYAREGQYGGYIIKLKKEDLTMEDAEALIENARAFLVEPRVREVEYKDLDEELKKIVDEYLKKLPEEVRKELTTSDDTKAEPFGIEILDYEYVEVKPVIKKSTENYVVLDFEPKPGGLKLNAKAIRVYVYYRGSNKYPRGKYADRKVKEWKLRYPDNDIVQRHIYAKQLSFKSSAIYLKIVVNAPKELLPKSTAVVEVDEEDLESLELDLEELRKEWGLTTSESKEEEKVERKEEAEELSPEEVKRLAENYLKRKGLLKLRLVVFKLPTEYLKSKTKMLKNEDGYVEEKRLSLDPSKFRTLRKSFYNTLHRLAWKSEIGWVLYRDADLKPIHEHIDKLNKLLKEHGIPQERYIEIIEAYIPKDFVVREITRYIKERKMAYEEIARKIKEQADKLKNIKQVKKHLEEIEEELKTLERELRYLQTQ